MNSSDSPHDSSGELYTLETLVQITHVSLDRILIYQQHGLISPAQVPAPDDPRFDDEAILRLRRISTILNEYGVNDHGLRMFFSLMDEVERLRQELRFHRG